MFYERIIDISKKCLVKDGRIYFEINPAMADKLKVLMMQEGFGEVTVLKDSFGKNRFIKGLYGQGNN